MTKTSTFPKIQQKTHLHSNLFNHEIQKNSGSKSHAFFILEVSRVWLNTLPTHTLISNRVPDCINFDCHQVYTTLLRKKEPKVSSWFLSYTGLLGLCFKCILRAFVSAQLFTKHLSSLRRLLQITLNNSFFFDLGSYMLLHLSLERIFLAKERPVFLIKPIWKRLSLIIRCMYILLSEMHFVEGYNNMFF